MSKLYEVTWVVRVGGNSLLEAAVEARRRLLGDNETVLNSPLVELIAGDRRQQVDLSRQECLHCASRIRLNRAGWWVDIEDAVEHCTGSGLYHEPHVGRQ